MAERGAAAPAGAGQCPQASPGPQHQFPERGGGSAGRPQDKDPGKLLTKVAGIEEWSDIGGANCELRGCQGASGNLVQQQRRGLGGGTAGALRREAGVPEGKEIDEINEDGGARE